MPHLRLYYHIVFVTHSRRQAINPERERLLYAYLVKVSELKGAKVLRVNSMPDHVHLLVEVGSNFILRDYIRDLKRSSSLMMKNSEDFPDFDRWAKEYSADSVSFSMVDVIRNYIKKQKEHHAVKSFETEMKEFFDIEDFSIYDEQS